VWEGEYIEIFFSITHESPRMVTFAFATGFVKNTQPKKMAKITYKIARIERKLKG
jgi:hypothetical protein